MKYRPTNLCTVYLEPQRIEVLQAHRHWRTWEIGAVEQFNVPAGEPVFDYLQHLNLKPKGRKGSALLAVVSSAFYSVHSEHYPLSIRDQINDAVNFDWQENIFQEHERTLHFSGPPVPLEDNISVPIFSIQMDVYDKLNQALNGILFHTFAVMPSALSFSALLPLIHDPGEDLDIIARRLDDDNFEVHRFYRGSFLDSTVVSKSSQGLKLLRENLKSLVNEERRPHLNLVCAPGEWKSYSDPAAFLEGTGVPVKVQQVDESLVISWLRTLLKQDDIGTFDSEVLLKPWQVPRILAPLAVLVLIFALYGIYQSRSTENLVRTSNRLKVQINQLETSWKPIEELQTRITKFQQDKKTLLEFNREDYQLLELLNLLTKVTPDDTWLNYLSLRQGQLILRGESRSALKYLADLSKTDGLTDVKFASPVTRDPGTDMERFNVQLHLDMEKLKQSFKAMPEEKPGEVSGGTPTVKPPAAVKGALKGPPSLIGEGNPKPPEMSRTVAGRSSKEGRR